MDGERFTQLEPLAHDQSLSQSLWRTPRWQVALLLLINAALIPLIVLIFYCQIQWGTGSGFLEYVNDAGMGIYNAELYLLALWMAFGGWPKRWRRLRITILTMIFGLLLGGAICIAFYFAEVLSFDDENEFRMLRLMFFGTPFVFALIIWVAHILLLFPQWYWGIVLDFRQVTPLAPRPTRQLGVIHYLTLMLFVAIPLGLLRFLSTADEMLNVQQLAMSMLPFVLLVATLLPISLSLLRSRLSMLALVLSFAWFALAVVLLLFLPPRNAGDFGPVMLLGTGIAATLNLILWRILGIRWLPHAPAPIESPFKPTDGPTWN